MPSNSSIAAVRKDTQRLRARSTDAVRGFHRCGQKRHTTTWSECSALETKRIEFPVQYVPAPAKCRIHVAAAQGHVSLPLYLNQNLSRTPTGSCRIPSFEQLHYSNHESHRMKHDVFFQQRLFNSCAESSNSCTHLSEIPTYISLR